MKKMTTIAFAIIFLIACKKDIKEISSNAVTQPESVANSNLQDPKITRPIHLELYSSVDLSSPTLTCTLPGVPFAIANSGYFLHGTATHFGLIDSQTSIGIDGFCNLSGTTFILATSTAGQIVAANGDKITYTGTDAIDLNNIIFNAGTTAAMTGVWTITGGTGRFEGATGSFSINGSVNVASPQGPVFSITGNGTITY